MAETEADQARQRLDELAATYGLSSTSDLQTLLAEEEDPPVVGYLGGEAYTTEQSVQWFTSLSGADLVDFGEVLFVQGYGQLEEYEDIFDTQKVVGAYEELLREAYNFQGRLEAMGAEELGRQFEEFALLPSTEGGSLAAVARDIRGMSPDEIREYMLSRAKNATGGGRSITYIDPAQLRAGLDQQAAQVLGRKANAEEQRMFIAGIHAAQRAGGQTINTGARAQEFLREQAPVEAGAMDLKNAGNLVLRALGMG